MEGETDAVVPVIQNKEEKIHSLSLVMDEKEKDLIRLRTAEVVERERENDMSAGF